MKKYNHFSSYCSVLALALTLIYLIVRIFVGLDFTDEMQYYGQIYGLLYYDKLFVTDFFIQQTGYLLIYPFLKLILLFDTNIQFFNLILYARLLLFLFIVLLGLLFFILTFNYRFISRVIGSCLIVISITEYLPFAFSYNSITYLLSSLILMLWLFFHNRHKIYIIAILIVLLGWTYPPIGILFAIIILADCIIFSNIKNFLKIFIYLFIFSFLFILLIFLLNFFDLNAFKKSLIFSSYFPSNFTLLFTFLIFILSIFIPFTIFCFLFFYENKLLLRIKAKYSLFIFFLSLFFFIFGFILILTKYFWPFSILSWFASICIMIFEEKKIEISKKILIFKILLSSLLISMVFSLTSGNGFVVLYRGFFITFGFLYLVLSSTIYKKKLIRAYVDILGLIIVIGILCNIIINPYRDKNIFSSFYNNENFIFHEKIFISKTKFLAINEIKRNIVIEKNKTLLVLGPHPWIYFALNAKPKTPYLFMHFNLGSKIHIKKIENFIIQNLENINSDYIINVMPNISVSLKSKIQEILKNYSCRDFVFTEKLNVYLKKEIHYELPSKISVCKKI